MWNIATMISFKILTKCILYTVALIILILAFSERKGLPSSKLARYGSIRNVQASGATATVYHYQLPNGRSYAVKQFRSKRKGVSEEAYIASVHNEVAIAARLHHPRLLTILDCFAENGTWYTVMPYIPTTLFDRVMGNGSVLTRDEGDCVFRQIMDGVSHIHDQGVAHLDIKLSNILLENDTGVKLIDFGHSHFFDNAQKASVQGKFGTPPNVPLEAYQASSYDPFAADVWAVGMVYCQLVAPTAPWNMASHADQFAMFSPSVPQGPSPPDMIHLQATVEMILNHIPLRARPLMRGMLQSNASNRVSMKDALSHEWSRSLHRCELDLASHI